MSFCIVIFVFFFYYRASLWLRYGILQSLEMLILTNSIGALLNFFYLILFYYFTSRKVRIHYLYCFRLKKYGDSILSLKIFPFNIKALSVFDCQSGS